MTPGAIVVGAHANGLGVIRSLGPRGIPLVAISTRPFDIAQHSRFVQERHALAQFHERPDALTTLARHHERLSRWYRLPVQPWEVVRHVVDKDRMDALAARTGVPLPVCYRPATAETAARSASGQQARTGKDMSCYLGDPDVDFAKLAAAFGVKGETITAAEQVEPAIQRAIASTREGRPYLIDAVVARTGARADSTWYPAYSVAARRTRKV
jgi:hypothetical protein